MFIQTRYHDFYIGHDPAPTHGFQRILRWVLSGKRMRCITLFGICFGSTRTSRR
jgi:hypothetical protein